MESINAMRPQAACPVLDDEQIGLYKPKPLGYYNEEYGTSNPVVPKMLTPSPAYLCVSAHSVPMRPKISPCK